MTINYDDAVDAAKAMIHESIKKVFEDVAELDGDFDLADVMADAQEEVYIRYLEANGIEVIDTQED